MKMKKLVNATLYVIEEYPGTARTGLMMVSFPAGRVTCNRGPRMTDRPEEGCETGTDNPRQVVRAVPFPSPFPPC